MPVPPTQSPASSLLEPGGTLKSVMNSAGTLAGPTCRTTLGLCRAGHLGSLHFRSVSSGENRVRRGGVPPEVFTVIWRNTQLQRVFVIVEDLNRLRRAAPEISNTSLSLNAMLCADATYEWVRRSARLERTAGRL